MREHHRPHNGESYNVQSSCIDCLRVIYQQRNPGTKFAGRLHRCSDCAVKLWEREQTPLTPDEARLEWVRRLHLH